MVAAAVIGAVATTVGTVASVSATNKASKTAQKTADKNNVIAGQVRTENIGRLEPYAAAGLPATKSIQALLGLAPEGQTAAEAGFQTFRDSTGYQFRKQEGEKAIEAALGKRGQLESGAAVKSALKYSAGLSDNTFDGYYGKLLGQQAVGLTGASAQAGVSQNYGNTVQANNTNAGNVAANAALANANTINSALGSAVSAYGFSQGMKSSYGMGGNLGG